MYVKLIRGTVSKFTNDTPAKKNIKLKYIFLGKSWMHHLSSSELELAQMTFGQNYDTSTDHKQSLCEVGIFKVCL